MSEEVTSDGRLLQVLAAATGNTRSLMLDSRDLRVNITSTGRWINVRRTLENLAAISCIMPLASAWSLYTASLSISMR